MVGKRSTAKTKRRKTDIITKEEMNQANRYFEANNLLLSPPIKRAAYSDRTAWVMASMSQLVYDRFEDNRKAKSLLRQKLKGGGFKMIDEFNSTKTDTQAFLVSNGDYAILAFRGTEVTKTKDIQSDAKAVKMSVFEGQVHRGFAEAYKSIEIQVLKGLKKIGDLPLYITGHSLGAAVATVATQSLERDPKLRDQIAACYTFGSPRVGNKEYDRDFKSAIYRVVNTTDIVTVVPLLAMGYIHIGDVRFLEPSMGDIRRGIPILRRIFFFLTAVFRLFGPLVGDHGIEKYRKKLEAVAQDRNIELYYAGGGKGNKRGR
ncbi:MAG TPA: lipase family protein [Anaerolineales bacterium]|nr:lipase family protein [Anaerolineales bacterium]